MCVFNFINPSTLLFSELTWWDWPLTQLTNHCPSVLWRCWLGHVTCKIVPEMTYNVLSGTLNPTTLCCILSCLHNCNKTAVHKNRRTLDCIIFWQLSAKVQWTAVYETENASETELLILPQTYRYCLRHNNLCQAICCSHIPSFFCLHPSLYLLVSWAWWDWPLMWLTNHRPSVIWPILCRVGR